MQFEVLRLYFTVKIGTLYTKNKIIHLEILNEIEFECLRYF